MDGFVRVVQESTPHVIGMEKIKGLCHWVPEIWTATGNGSVSIINSQVDLDMYWDVY
jgi:hypothetical protein